MDLGNENILLGARTEGNVSVGAIILTQETCARNVPNTSGKLDARPIKTPPELAPVQIREEGVLPLEDTPYFRAASGSLLIRIRCPGPDVPHSVRARPTR